MRLQSRTGVENAYALVHVAGVELNSVRARITDS